MEENRPLKTFVWEEMVNRDSYLSENGGYPFGTGFVFTGLEELVPPVRPWPHQSLRLGKNSDD